MDRSEPVVLQLQNLKDFRERASNGEIVRCCKVYYPQVLADKYLVGTGERFRHAGFTGSDVGEIVPAELYAGRESIKGKSA